MRRIRHRKVLETIGGMGVAAALVAAPLVVAGTAAGAAETAEATTVLDLDFEDGTWGDWTPIGSTVDGARATVAVVEDEGGHVLQVADRVSDHDGIRSPDVRFEAGASYTFSMRAKLAEGTEGTADLRFVTVVGEQYGWVANTTVDADGWTTLTGTASVPAGTGGVFIGSGDLSTGGPYTFLVDDLLVTSTGGGAVDPGPAVDLSFDFEDGTLQGWEPRATEQGPPTLEVAEGDAHGGDHAARVTDRVHQGQGIQYPVTGVLTPGSTYDFEAWLRFDDAPGDLTLSVRTVSGETTTYGNLAQLTGIGTEWTRVAGTFSMPAYVEAAEIYLETPWDNGNAGNTSTFLVDDVSITSPPPPVIEDITPLHETVPFPMGVAIDSRETLGAPGELTAKHFDQLTGENHMKPEAWYSADRTFRIHPDATAIMDFARDNDQRVYGHVLVWHSQNPGQTAADPETGTPASPGWMFLDEDGAQLTSSEEDQAVLRERLRTHVFAIAENLATTYGPFGSEGNPLVAWDVVNEVVSDGAENPDGLRRSAWFQILGEQFIDLAFIYADEAFNETYAAPGSDRPVTLFINDYNTEQSGKQDRYYALVERLVARGVPIDGVGHQFHVSLRTPVSALEAAIERFEALDVVQAVTELDVATGTPVTDALLVEQGYYFRDAFEVFRDHADSMYSVTVWGLNDGRSWVVDNGAPLLFDDRLRAKPAYYGAAGGDLPPRIVTATVFGGSVPLDEGATSAVQWRELPLRAVGDAGQFQLRWDDDALTVLVEADDSVDSIEVQVGETTYEVDRSGDGDVEAVVEEVDGGWRAVLRAPLTGGTVGGTVQFDLRLVGDGDTVGWAGEGTLGTLTLLEELSVVEVARAAEAPEVDGEVDDAYEDVEPVVTAKQVSGTGTATAEVRTLWEGDTLYVLAEVTDPVVDVSGSDPWIQDSVELYVDAGNAKNGTYRTEDMQVRVSAENVVSFGTGDEAAQRARVSTATARTATGYVVEASIDLLGTGGADSVHGVDFQVNDAAEGGRIGITNWADPTGAGYQSTARWGVALLVDDVEPGPTPTPTPTATATPKPPKPPKPTAKPTHTAKPKPTHKPRPTVAPPPKPGHGPKPGTPGHGPKPGTPGHGHPKPSQQVHVAGKHVHAGGMATVRLTGFRAGEKVTLALRSAGPRATTTKLVEVRVGPGATVVRVPVPARTAAGAHTLVASVGGKAVADTRLEVEAPRHGGGRG